MRGTSSSGSVAGIGGMADFNATIPAGRVGLRASASGSRFDNFKVRSLAANCVVDGRFIDDVGNVRVSGGKLEFYNDDGTTRRTVLRHVRMSKGIVRADLTWPALDCGIILNYQDPENFAVALLDVDAGTITPRYVEFIEGRKQEAKGNYGTSFTFTLDTAAAAKRPGSLRDRRAALGPACQGLTAGQTYGVQAVVRAQYPANAVRLYLDRNQDGDFGDQDELVLTNFMIFGTWGGGHVGLYRATSTTTTTLQWDNFLCGYDVDNDEVIGTVTNPDPGDYLYARYTFDDPGGGVTWQQIAYTHDANGNLTGDGLYKYTYDAWNRLSGVWYHDCAVDGNGVPSDAYERVARYRYDGLFRRVSKQVTNQGTGVVFRSDDLDRNGTPDATGILAGDRHEHYYYAGWRLVETTNHVTSGGGYSYGDSAVLSQFAYGTQYIDEPVRYDRNLQAGTNTSCIGTGGGDLDASYYYHQDANWRTVALTGEDGQIVERVEYTAYGEPTLFGGPAPGGDDDSGAAGELGNAMLVSTVGNPLLHQGLFPLTRRERAKPAARDASRPALRAAACPGFRDRETLTYHNRFRQYDSRSGRFMQRDPLGYIDGLNVYEHLRSKPHNAWDPLGLELVVGGSKQQKCKIEDALRKLCPAASVGDDGRVTINEDAEGANSPGCDRLRKLIKSKRKYIITIGGTHAGEAKKNKNWGGQPVSITFGLKRDHPERWIRNKDGSVRLAEDWEVAYHEIIHATHIEDGTWNGNTSPAEEKTTIEEMNGLRQDYNAHNPEDEADIPERDPNSHGSKFTEEEKQAYRDDQRRGR